MRGSLGAKNPRHSGWNEPGPRPDTADGWGAFAWARLGRRPVGGKPLPGSDRSLPRLRLKCVIWQASSPSSSALLSTRGVDVRLT